MSLTTSIPDLSELFRTLCDICLAGAILGCFFTLIASGTVLVFPGETRSGFIAQPPVTVLKPLHGTEPGLRARLAAYCRQDYQAPIQVLCGTPDHASPAAAAVRGLKIDSPNKTVELAVDPRSHGANRKVSNLINIMPRARHDTLVMSDSDIVVGPDYLRGLAALLAQPRVGAVTCLYYGIGGEALWSRLSALAINAQFLPHAITAVSLGLAKPCCGATIAMRRAVLEHIGGFRALADVLADDHAIGLAVRAAGYEVVTAPFLVGHHCFENSLRQLLRHQLRVARTIRSIDPVAYAGTFVTHPWPLALIATLSGSATAALIAVIALLSRVALCRCVERRFGLRRQNYLLVPVHDIIAFAVYLTGFFGAKVHWQGADYRVAPDGSLIEDKT